MTGFDNSIICPTKMPQLLSRQRVAAFLQKMCAKFAPENFSTPGGHHCSGRMPFKKMSVQKKVSLRAITGYTPAKLITGKRWYVEFYAFDPEKQNLHRKRVSVPPVKPQSLRKRHAADMAAEINAKLAKGWNPFLAVMWTKPVGDIIYKILIEG